MSFKQSLIKKIKSKKAKILIVGLGYVGLPICLEFVNKNYNVIGFDSDISKINLLKQYKSYIHQINLDKYKKKLKKYFIPTNNKSFYGEADIIVFCLPTPLNKNLTPDLKYVSNSLKDYYKFMRKGQVLCFESTSYPGTTKEYFISLIKKKKLQLGKDIFLVYSPEREDPGNQKFKIN